MATNLTLDDPIGSLKGIGEYYEERLKKLNIRTLRDLLFYFPFRYQDFTHIKSIGELQEEETATIIATITKISGYRTPRRHMTLIQATAEDETGTINLLWFNQPYLLKTLKKGLTLAISGKTKKEGKKLVLQNPAFEIITQDKDLDIQQLKHTGRLVPIYSETQGITSKMLRSYIKILLKMFANKIPESLPEEVRARHNLLDIKTALWEMHFPDSYELAQQAKNRFVFEEMLLVQLHLLNLKNQLSQFKAPTIDKDIDAIKEFINSLPFTLTHCQRQAIWEMMQDISSGRPMNRLLEGDVGSGKTIVALAVASLFLKNNYQVAFMAPTEVLAKQHFNTAIKFLDKFQIKIALLTSEGVRIKDGFLEGKVSKDYLSESLLGKGTPWFVIGTHALIQKNIVFSNLGFVIIDEQHRFGVNQRSLLLHGSTGNISVNPSESVFCPHLLSMTATPIPRTLALAMYGDLDLSILNEMPQGRKKVITKIITKKSEDKMFEFISKEVQKGKQAFVICPRIEDSSPECESTQISTQMHTEKATKTNLFSCTDWLNYDVKAVKKEFERIKKIFPEFKIEMLHGKMKSEEKESVMQRFQKNEINILVATSVIEVGIDIPNATIIVIEGAEHFGLAQLHQFRGRVGRSDEQSYCFLLVTKGGKNTRERLKAMLQYSDGFKLAEIDLNLRGPGEFFGINQSGFPDLAMQALSNTKVLAEIQEEAKTLIKEDSTLQSWPNLWQRYQEFLQKFHME